jgi:hypothetical protein
VVCPFASLAGVASAAPVFRGLFVRDRAGRPFTWLVLILLVAGWAAYVPMGRPVGFRITLEIATVAAIVVGLWRWAHWARAVGGPGAARRELNDAFHDAVGTLRHPAVIAAGVWLLAMIVTEWRGKTRFDAAEYVVVTTLFVTLVIANGIIRRRASAFATLESFEPSCANESCPLGFGAEKPTPITDRSVVE